MGRHGGSGPRARQWLATSVVSALADEAAITDSNNATHRARNVRLLPAHDLASTTPGHPRYGMILPGAAPRTTYCAAPYGRGNGWEGRSAAAVRQGCVPLLIFPPRTEMPLEPFVPWRRFSVAWSDAALTATPQRQRTAAWDGEAARLRAHLAAHSWEVDVDRMHCEMACAATHMSWEAPSCPPASCALAAQGKARRERTGALATLLTVLGNRRRPPAERLTPRACPCDKNSSEWHFFDG